MGLGIKNLSCLENFGGSCSTFVQVVEVTLVKVRGCTGIKLAVGKAEDYRGSKA